MKNQRSKGITFLLLFLLFTSPIIYGQASYPLVYEFGPTMMNLMMKQLAHEGAGPLDLEGFRQGIELELGEKPISVIIKSEQILVIRMKENFIEGRYLRKGLRLMVQNKNTGEYFELGFFNWVDNTSFVLPIS